MRVAYILSRFPTLTTTFVHREVEAIRRLGVDVEIFSVWRPRRELLSDETLPSVETTTYFLPGGLYGLPAAHLRFVLGRPRRYWGLLARVLAGPPRQGWRTRLRALSHFVQGVPISRWIERRRIDRLHAHFADKATTIAMVASRLLDRPFSFTAHARDLFVDPVLLEEKIRRCDFVAVVCRANADLLDPRGEERRASRMHVVHAGVDLTELDPGQRDPAPTPLVLSIGRLVEKKGHADLIRAVAKLRDEGVGIRCRIVGAGPLRADLQTLIDTLHVRDAVELRGALRHEQVREQLRQATLFALPCVVAGNADRDGIPVVLMEAMAMTVPVISTPVAGVPELIRDGENGLLVPCRDTAALAAAIGRLVADRELRDRLGRAGRETVEADFDARRSAAQMVRLFRGQGSADDRRAP